MEKKIDVMYKEREKERKSRSPSPSPKPLEQKSEKEVNADKPVWLDEKGEP